jgi:CrcB protein
VTPVTQLAFASVAPDTWQQLARHFARQRHYGGKNLKAALINAAIVGSGGFIGAIARYSLSGLVHRQVPFATFPYGTMVVNLIGCSLIGVAVGLAESRQLFGPEFRMFALIGILGGFTTFSTFGYETFAMIRDAEYFRAAANVGGQVILGLALVWLGYTLTAAR